MAQVVPVRRLLPRAWYSAPISAFLAAESIPLLGALAAASGSDITEEQRDAWLAQILCLQAGIVETQGAIHLEFEIPRMGHRADAVIVAGSAVVVVEFKSSRRFHPVDIAQVLDYALDLKHFHKASHDLPIVPVLVAMGDTSTPSPSLIPGADAVYSPICIGADGLADTMALVNGGVCGTDIDSTGWLASPYFPTPTIVEVARALYANHSVEEIACSAAAEEQKTETTGLVRRIAQEARRYQRKAILFVTGVPGAGKTLVGLDVASQRPGDDSHAVFLSGNGPLVEVLRAALRRDERARRKAQSGATLGKGPVPQAIKSFIQNIHHFRDEGLKHLDPPAEHFVVFDESQRAWTRAKLTEWMARRKGRKGFDRSEPEFLIECMDRHRDWATVVCLVGGGQEINRGEAGIGEWLATVNERFRNWDVYISPHLTDSEYAAGDALDALQSRPHTHFDPALHLSVSIRSFRAENLSRFVKCLLDCDVPVAREEFARLKERYPIVLSRDLDVAKRWVREKTRGTRRCGLLATSKAMRLKPHAIDVRVDVNPVHWFLNDADDVRSSSFLEDAATEFDVQGLEVDWACVTWDGDLRYRSSGWGFHNFRGSRWENIKDAWSQTYTRNAYRVLLTRARSGMAIFVPRGDEGDRTRSPEYYDGTFDYLASLGLPVIS